MLVLPPFFLGLLWSVAAQQPPKPTFPPINPGIAKLSQTATGLTGCGLGIAYNDSKGVLAAACEDGTLHLWTKEENKELLSGDAKGKSLKAHDKAVTAVATGGAVFATGSTDGTVRVWNVPPEKPGYTLKAGASVRCVALTEDGKTLASGGEDNVVQLWDPATGKAGKKLTGPTDWVTALAFSQDGKLLAAGGQDGRLWVWKVPEGEKAFDVLAQQPPAGKTEVEKNIVSALAFSPDRKQIALGGSDGKVYLFQTDNGKYIRTLQGHTGAITALVYHPGNAALVSASKDRTLRLWNPQNGQPLKTLEGHTAWVQGVLFLERGIRLASTSADRTVRLWELTPPMPKKK